MSVLQPWDYQPSESAQAYAAFRAYRDAGPGRSTSAVAETIGKQKSLVQRWSAAHQWVERVAAWETSLMPEIDRLVADRQIAAVRERLEAADLLRSKAIKSLEGVDPAELRPVDAVKMLEAAERIETSTLNAYEPGPLRDQKQQADADFAASARGLMELLRGGADV